MFRGGVFYGKLLFTQVEEVYMTTQGNTAPGTVLNPEVISVYSHGWNKLWKPFWILLLMLIIIGAVSAIANFIPFVGFLLGLFLSNPLNYGMSFAYLKAARGETVDINDQFSIFQNYWNVFLASLLTGIIVCVGFIFLIIPGIYLACKLAFVPYLVMDKKLQVIDALKVTWKMTDGYFWQVFLVYLLAIPIVIAGVICLGVGVIVAVMWINMALASLYYAVSMAKPSLIPAPTVNTAPPAA
jgi:uncharacterized membrane protein